MTYDVNHMITAYAVADQSACYSGKVGCVLVSSDGKIVTGYNAPLDGFPSCYEAGGCLMRNDGKKDRCVRTVHAEMWCATKCMNRQVPLRGAVVYQTKMCCLYCAKLLARLGVAIVYYVEPNSTLPSVGVEMFLPMQILRVDDPRKTPR